MRTLIIDPFHGAAGDMIIGALLPLLSEREEVLKAMASVVAQPSVEIVNRCSITAYKVHTHASPIQRTAVEVQAIIQSAPVPAEVRKKACNVFERIKRAESRVHGYETDSIEDNQDHTHQHSYNHEVRHETTHHHFHEVGADDAIADIIGSCMALHLLSPDRVIILPVATGKGTVKIAHGIVPVPAPATAAILHESSLITQFGQGDGELLTPTGAALLAELADENPLQNIYEIKGRIIGVGYGAGSRDDPISPNVIRMILIEDIPSVIIHLPYTRTEVEE